MDPLLSIIKYIFKRKGIINEDESIDTFFENGVSFPQLISLVFDEDIPKINQNPKNIFHKKTNNNLALQFLCQKNKNIAKFNPTYETNVDKANLLLLIFTKQLFNLNIDEIIDKCNLITQSINIKFEKKSDIFNPNCIIYLLSILSNGKVQIKKDMDILKNFDEIMTEAFKLANAPLVINKSSLDIQNQNIFLIQIEILFEFFSDEIKQIENRSQSTPKQPSEDEIRKMSTKEEVIKIVEQQETINMPKQEITNMPEQEIFNTPEQQETNNMPEQQEITNMPEQETINMPEQETINMPEQETINMPEQETINMPEQQEIINMPEQETINMPEQQEIANMPEQQEIINMPEQQETINMPEQETINMPEQQEIANMPEQNHDQEEEEEEEEFIEETGNQYKNNQNEKANWKKIDSNEKLIPYKSKDSKAINFVNERLQYDALLKTINYLGRSKFHFNNFNESAMNDSIPKFVMFYLQIDTIPNVSIESNRPSQKTQKITKEELDNINAVIEFLKTKELVFNILKLDFSNPKTVENSAYVFYSMFLNSFFLKSTKKEIYERVSRILCAQIKFDDYNNFHDLIESHTFVYLLSYYKKRCFPKDYYIILKFKDIEQYFEEAQIPMIINDEICKIGIGNNMPDCIYYQYQLILDAIDSGPKCLVVYEIFLIVISKLMKMKVPDFSNLAKSIHVKRISFEFQKKRSDQYLKRTKSQSLSENNMLNTGSSQDEPLKKPISIKTYSIRCQESNKNETKQSSSIINESSYSSKDEIYEKLYSSFDRDIVFSKGILYNKSNEIKNWGEEIKNMLSLSLSTSDEIKEVDEKKQMISFKNSQVSIESKLYKIFRYDESSQSWSFQSDVFEQFASEKRINIDDSKVPVVLIMNSYEEDSISLVSNLINGFYPQLENEEDIFIYAFCDKTLAMLNFNVNFKSKKKSSIKPMFLLLHVPKNKEIMPNLQSAIFEIYTFLTLISDLEIVILDQNYYSEQINMMTTINDMTRIYKKINSTKSKNKNNKSKSSDSSEDNYDDDDDDDDNDDDDDGNDINDKEKDDYKNGKDNKTKREEEEEEEIIEEYEEEEWENINSNTNDNYNEDFLNIFVKNPKAILLINDQSVPFDKKLETRIKNCEFFQNLKSTIKGKCGIHYIDVKKPDTYEYFLKSFNKKLTKYECSLFKEIKANFNSIAISKMNPNYIIIRIYGSDWKIHLEQIINAQINELKSDSSDLENSYVIISKVRNEIEQICPIFDIDFKKEINMVLSKFKTSIIKKNQDLYSSELEKSAESHLEYLNDKINQEFFWNEEQMDLLKKSHFIFLKNELFDIIKLTSKDKFINPIYEDNLDILEKQIQVSENRINEIFKPFVEKINTKKNIKELNIKERIQKGANYCMRETENIREIKVTVKINKDLKSEIPQDF